jgi:hypothetical protein
MYCFSGRIACFSLLERTEKEDNIMIRQTDGAAISINCDLQIESAASTTHHV